MLLRCYSKYKIQVIGIYIVFLLITLGNDRKLMFINLCCPILAFMLVGCGFYVFIYQACRGQA
jgi:hypothetical protein